MRVLVAVVATLEIAIGRQRVPTITEMCVLIVVDLGRVLDADLAQTRVDGLPERVVAAARECPTLQASSAQQEEIGLTRTRNATRW